MFKKLGFPIVALAALLSFATPKPADARVHFGISIGGPVYTAPVAPYAYSYPYAYPATPYVDPYAYSYSYPYTYPEYVAPYGVYGGYYGHWGHRDYDHDRDRGHFERHEFRGGGHERGGHRR